MVRFISMFLLLSESESVLCWYVLKPLADLFVKESGLQAQGFWQGQLEFSHFQNGSCELLRTLK